MNRVLFLFISKKRERPHNNKRNRDPRRGHRQTFSTALADFFLNFLKFGGAFLFNGSSVKHIMGRQTSTTSSTFLLLQKIRVCVFSCGAYVGVLTGSLRATHLGTAKNQTTAITVFFVTRVCNSDLEKKPTTMTPNNQHGMFGGSAKTKVNFVSCPVISNRSVYTME